MRPIVLAGWNLGAWRVALRVDAFSTEQLPRSLADRIREHGSAGTFALNWRPHQWLRLSGEWLQLRSWRNQRLLEGLPERQTDNQMQLSARVLF